MSRRGSRRRARAPPVWSCLRPDRLARAGPTRAAPLGWLRLAAVMGGTLVTHGGDIATACHQRPAHHVVRGRGGGRSSVADAYGADRGEAGGGETRRGRCGARGGCGGGGGGGGVSRWVGGAWGGGRWGRYWLSVGVYA